METAILQGIAVPTFAIDARHLVTHFNPACENLTGIRASEIIGTSRQWAPFYAHERPILADLIVDRAGQEVIDRYYPGKAQPSAVIPGAFEGEDFFPDLGDRGKWLFFTAAPMLDASGTTTGAIVTLQDITREMLTARQNETLLRISQSLHEYPELEDLLDFISREIREESESAGALVILLDEETREHYCVGSAYTSPETGQRVKQLRFAFDQLAAGEVVATGEPKIINDPEIASAYPGRDSKVGYRTRNLVLVPLKSGERVIGVLAALNKLDGGFDHRDVELLNSIAGTVTLSVENARISDQLKASFDQVCTLNRTKDRAITHLSHELKTPVAILSGGLDILGDALGQVQEREWRGTMDMLHRNLARIAGIQAEVQDIMRGASTEVPELATRLLELAGDELSLIVAQETGSPLAVEAVREHLRNRYLPEVSGPETILLGPWLERLIQDLKPAFSHRSLSVACLCQGDESVVMPEDVLRKVMEGLIRNAVENTPDQGRIDIEVFGHSGRTTVSVRDYGVGIAPEDQGRIFEGLSPLQEALAYSTKKPFDFGAGGKCLDLLRIKIFSEQVGFTVGMRSERCMHLAKGRVESCPGKVDTCPACEGTQDCLESGGTVLALTFAGPAGRGPDRPDPE